MSELFYGKYPVLDPATAQAAVKVSRPEEDWRSQLGPDSYHVLREAGTERPYTGELLDEARAGKYLCRGCGAHLFDSQTKFDAGCGWPSFYEAVDNSAVQLIGDYTRGMQRVEVRCANCGGHLGHIFPDAPQTPTGDRYCMNSLSLKFSPDADADADADAMPMTKPRRPASLDHYTAQQIPGGPDPAQRSQLAHEFARLLVTQGREQSHRPEILERLVRLVETEGIDLLAELWAREAAETLPGTLWRLYLLREWVRRDSPAMSRHFRDGVHATPVPEVVAGAGLGYGPQEMTVLLDAILTGVFAGELDVALERAAAFCRVVAVGMAADADRREPVDRASNSAHQLTYSARSLLATAGDLEVAAEMWRGGSLD